MTIPFKALRIPVDIKGYPQVLSHCSNDKYAEAAIKLTEVLIEKSGRKAARNYYKE